MISFNLSQFFIYLLRAVRFAIYGIVWDLMGGVGCMFADGFGEMGGRRVIRVLQRRVLFHSKIIDGVVSFPPSHFSVTQSIPPSPIPLKTPPTPYPLPTYSHPRSQYNHLIPRLKMRTLAQNPTVPFRLIHTFSIIVIAA